MKKLALLGLSLFVFTTNALAYSKKEYSEKEVEQYMGSLKSFSASFDQVVPGEDFAKGKLYIKKPGKFLWQYKIPEPVKIVSNGGLVYFVDEANSQTTQVPSTGILFSLLSRKEVSFNTEHLKLVNLLQNDKRINVDLIAKVEDYNIPVTIIIEKTQDGLKLMKIISQNQLDQTIVVSLYNQKHDAKINNDIFKVDIEEDEAR